MILICVCHHQTFVNNLTFYGSEHRLGLLLRFGIRYADKFVTKSLISSAQMYNVRCPTCYRTLKNETHSQPKSGVKWRALRKLMEAIRVRKLELSKIKILGVAIFCGSKFCNNLAKFLGRNKILIELTLKPESFYPNYYRTQSFLGFLHSCDLELGYSPCKIIKHDLLTFR